MQTMNVSIPESQAKEIKSVMSEGRFASRSELFRTAIRVFLSLEKAQGESLDTYKKRPVEEVRKELLKAGYNENFANSVADGLVKSSLYTTDRDEN